MSIQFVDYPMPPALVLNLRDQNPWWQAAAMPNVPRYRRWPYKRIMSWLRNPKPLAPILAMRGPRQVGKSSLQLQVIQTLLHDGIAPERIFRVQFDELASLEQIPGKDDPILRIADWFSRAILQQHFNAAANAGAPAFLFFDEVQNLPSWHVQLKSLVDHASVRAMITGSSALQIERGRDSLAGRIQTLEIGPLRLTEIAAIRGWEELPPFQPDNGLDAWISAEFWSELVKHARNRSAHLERVFKAFSDRGAYPMPHANPDAPWADIADFLNETVVERVIQHDLQAEHRGDNVNATLMRDVFRMVCRCAGQAPRPARISQETNLQLSSGLSQTNARQISSCLAALDQSLLIRTIDPLEARRKPVHGSKKLTLCDHVLRAAMLRELIPLVPSELDQSPPNVQTDAGFLADSTVGYYLASLTNKSIGHLPGGEDVHEVDYVVTIGEKRIPIEVKYRSAPDASSAKGLAAFLDNPLNNAPLALFVTRDFEPAVPIQDPRIVCVPLPALLLLR